jgi:hypothetical protein
MTLELKVLVSIFMLTMSAFSHKYIVLLIGFCRVHNILFSVITMSWSDRSGSGLQLLTNDGLSGDFNLGDISWSSGNITSSNHPKDLNRSFLDTFKDCLLEQIVNFPTRKKQDSRSVYN